MADRFAVYNEDEIQILLHNAIPQNTQKTTKYGMKIFNGK